MKILIDTSTPICRLTLIDSDFRYDNEWEAGRTLAKNLLSYLNDSMKKFEKSWPDIESIGVFEGPGSFTGLRIGITVMNTIADCQSIPIVGARGDNWQIEALNKLSKGLNEKIILPFYGSEAHVTTPRK